MKKKKRKRSISLVGLQPILAFCHNIVHCIMTGMAGACSRVSTTLPGGPVTRPHDMAEGPATRFAAARARRHGTRGRGRGGTARATQCAIWLGVPYNTGTTRRLVRHDTIALSRSVRAACVASPKPDPTRLASPNRNPGDARFISFYFSCY